MAQTRLQRAEPVAGAAGARVAGEAAAREEAVAATRRRAAWGAGARNCSVGAASEGRRRDANLLGRRFGRRRDAAGAAASQDRMTDCSAPADQAALGLRRRSHLRDSALQRDTLGECRP